MKQKYFYQILKGTSYPHGENTQLNLECEYTNLKEAIKEFNYIKKDINGYTAPIVVTQLEKVTYIINDEGERENIDWDIIKLDERPRGRIY